MGLEIFEGARGRDNNSLVNLEEVVDLLTTRRHPTSCQSQHGVNIVVGTHGWENGEGREERGRWSGSKGRLPRVIVTEAF
jgi:hypothetical protein